jgi:oligoendopeptidase F
MALFEKGNKRGHRFTSEDQPKSRGRGHLSVLKYIQQTTGKKVDPKSGKEDILRVMRHLYESSTEELEPLLKDPDDKTKPNKKTPTWVLNFISAMNTDIRYGRTATLEMMFDRVFGKATQNIEGEINANVSSNLDLSALSDEELLQYNTLLDKMRNGAKNGKEQ